MDRQWGDTMSWDSPDLKVWHQCEYYKCEESVHEDEIENSWDGIYCFFHREEIAIEQEVMEVERIRDEMKEEGTYERRGI